MGINLVNYITGNIINVEGVNKGNPWTLKEIDLKKYNEDFAYEIAAVSQWLNCMDKESREYALDILKLTDK